MSSGLFFRRSLSTTTAPLVLLSPLIASALMMNAASGQAAAIVASAAANNDDIANEEGRARASGGGRGGGVYRRDLSRQELVEAAARAGMEIVDSEDQDWVHASRRLAYEGQWWCGTMDSHRAIPGRQQSVMEAYRAAMPAKLVDIHTSWSRLV